MVSAHPHNILKLFCIILLEFFVNIIFILSKRFNPKWHLLNHHQTNLIRCLHIFFRDNIRAAFNRIKAIFFCPLKPFNIPLLIRRWHKRIKIIVVVPKSFQKYRLIIKIKFCPLDSQLAHAESQFEFIFFTNTAIKSIKLWSVNRPGYKFFKSYSGF